MSPPRRARAALAGPVSPIRRNRRPRPSDLGQRGQAQDEALGDGGAVDDELDARHRGPPRPLQTDDGALAVGGVSHSVSRPEPGHSLRQGLGGVTFAAVEPDRLTPGCEPFGASGLGSVLVTIIANRLANWHWEAVNN